MQMFSQQMVQSHQMQGVQSSVQPSMRTMPTAISLGKPFALQFHMASIFQEGCALWGQKSEGHRGVLQYDTQL